LVHLTGSRAGHVSCFYEWLQVAGFRGTYRMIEKLGPWARMLDTIFYWLFVGVFIVGIFTAQLIPPKLDVVAFAGIVFACFILKPMVLGK
jgi:hypothetical protein